MKFLSGRLFLLMLQSAVQQQDQLQHTAKRLLLLQFPPEEDPLPAGMLTEEDLQLEGGQGAADGDILVEILDILGQEGGETSGNGVGLGFFQQLVQGNQQLAETPEGETPPGMAQKSAPEDTLLIGIDAKDDLSVSRHPQIFHRHAPPCPLMVSV